MIKEAKQGLGINMGHLFSKDHSSNRNSTKLDSRESLVGLDRKAGLYKPKSEFDWKNASHAELHREGLAHYAKKFR